MKKRQDGYVGGLCDPTKATTCKKTHCSYENKGLCRYTTNIAWLKNKDLKN